MILITEAILTDHIILYYNKLPAPLEQKVALFSGDLLCIKLRVYKHIVFQTQQKNEFGSVWRANSIHAAYHNSQIKLANDKRSERPRRPPAQMLVNFGSPQQGCERRRRKFLLNFSVRPAKVVISQKAHCRRLFTSDCSLCVPFSTQHVKLSKDTESGVKVEYYIYV